MSTPTVTPTEAKAPRGAIRLGRVGSIPLYLSPSWILGALALYAIFLTSFTPYLSLNERGSAWILALLNVVSLMVAVVCHEVAHAWVAQLCGHRVHNITLTPWGGYTYSTTYRPTPLATGLIGMAGPATNIALWLVALPLADLMPTHMSYLVVLGFATINKWLALFNILPGLPLDGGHLTTALVWWISGQHTTGLKAGMWCGRVIAIAVMAYFMVSPMSGEPSLTDMAWALLIGWMLWSATSSISRQIHTRETLDQLTAAGISRPAIVVATGTRLDRAYAQAPDLRTTLLVWDGQHIVGWVPPVILDTQAAASAVDTFAQPCEPIPFDVTLTTPVTDLAIGMATEDMPAVALRLPTGEPRLLTLVDVDQMGTRFAAQQPSEQ